MTEKKYNFSAFNNTPAAGSTYDFSAMQEPATPEIVQVMHPDIDWGERSIIKNFGSDPSTSAQWLKKTLEEKKKTPYDVTLSPSGQIIVKKQGEREYRVLDPEGFGEGNIFKQGWEGVQDLTDAGYDIATGIGEGAASALAGVGVGLLTGGTGAIPAAMATGGVLSGGAELLRQNIGAGLGVGQDQTNWQDVGISAGLGAASPFLFGTGGKIAKEALTDKALTKALSKKDITLGPKEALSNELRDIATESLETSQKGILSRSAGGLREMLTGIDNNLADKAIEVVSPETLAKLNDAGFHTPPGKTISKLRMANVIEQRQPGQLGEAVVDKISEAIEGKRAELQQLYTQALQESGATLDIGPLLKPMQELAERLEEQSVRDNSKALAKDAADVRAIINEYFGKKEGGGLLGEVGLDTFMSLKRKVADDIINYNQTAKSAAGLSTDTKVVRNAAIDMERAMSDLLDTEISKGMEGGIAAKYRKLRNDERFLQQHFSDDPVKAFNTIRNLSSQAKRPVRDALKNFDKSYGTNLSEIADIGNIWMYFGGNKKTTLPGEGSGKVIKGSTLGAMLGSIAGYVGAQAMGSPAAARQAMAVAGMGGASIGQGMVSPWFVKKYLQTKYGVKKGAGAVADAIPESIKKKLQYIKPGPMALPTPWALMNTGGE